MPLYRLVEPEEEGGTPTYVEVNETEIEVPENHPKLKAALDAAKSAKEEAIKQRQRYKQLRDQIAAEEEGGSDEEEGETPNPQQPAQFNPEELFADFKRRLKEEQDKELTEAQQRDNAVNEALKKHKLPKDLAPVLKSVPLTELEGAAATIAKTGLRFDNPAAGAGDVNKPFDPADVIKRMGLVPDED